MLHVTSQMQKTVNPGFVSKPPCMRERPDTSNPEANLKPRAHNLEQHFQTGGLRSSAIIKKRPHADRANCSKSLTF